MTLGSASLTAPSPGSNSATGRRMPQPTTCSPEECQPAPSQTSLLPHAQSLPQNFPPSCPGFSRRLTPWPQLYAGIAACLSPTCYSWWLLHLMVARLAECLPVHWTPYTWHRNHSRLCPMPLPSAKPPHSWPACPHCPGPAGSFPSLRPWGMPSH